MSELKELETGCQLMKQLRDELPTCNVYVHTNRYKAVFCQNITKFLDTSIHMCNMEINVQKQKELDDAKKKHKESLCCNVPYDLNWTR